MPCFPDSGWELWAGRALYIPMSYITVALPLILMKNTMNQVSLTGRSHILRNTFVMQNVLLIAAGGGREVIALSKMGIKVDGYECNPRLVEFGNSLLKKHDINSSIKYLERNSVPDDIKQYDGIIIGWGAYSLIRGHETRIGFLNSLKPFFKPETLLMASFVYSTRRRRKDKIIKQVADFLSFFHKKDRTEIGDRLVTLILLHYFSEDEIKSEFAQAGLDVIDYSGTGYGCLIARC